MVQSVNYLCGSYFEGCFNLLFSCRIITHGPALATLTANRLTASAVPLGDQVVLSFHDLGGQRVLFLLVVVKGVRDQVG